MEYRQEMELAKWMAKVSEKYSQPILLVVNRFNEVAKEHQDINLVKLKVVQEFSQVEWGR